VTASAAVRMTRATFAYADRVAAQVIEAYEAERHLWGNGRAAARAESVSALLAGEDVDVEATELALGYRLRRRHLGVVVSVDDTGTGATELALLDRVVRRVAERLGAAGAPLFIPRDATSAWAWVPLASGQALPADGLALSTRDVEERAHVVVGDPEDDVGGFGRTHRQALRVEAVALAAGAARRRVTAFAEIRPIALMSGGPGRQPASGCARRSGRWPPTRSRMPRLRETVRIYLDAGGYTAAASRLFVHTNTVHYRVQKAEESTRPAGGARPAGGGARPARLPLVWAPRFCSQRNPEGGTVVQHIVLLKLKPGTTDRDVTQAFLAAEVLVEHTPGHGRVLLRPRPVGPRPWLRAGVDHLVPRPGRTERVPGQPRAQGIRRRARGADHRRPHRARRGHRRDAPALTNVASWYWGSARMLDDY
jgi:hypothetical protein